MTIEANTVEQEEAVEQVENQEEVVEATEEITDEENDMGGVVEEIRGPQGTEEEESEQEEEEEGAEEPPEVESEESTEFIETVAEAMGVDGFQTQAEAIVAAKEYIKANVEGNKNVINLLNEVPDMADVIRDVGKGSTFREAIARHIDLESLEAQEGDADYDVIQKAKKERKARIQEFTEYQAEMEVNQQNTMADLEAFKTTNKLDDKTMDGYLQKVITTIDEIKANKLSPEFLTAIFTALNHDSEIQEAIHAGEVKGRNTKIEVKKAESANKGDGLPNIQGKNTPPKRKVKVDSFSQGLADHVNKRTRF